MELICVRHGRTSWNVAGRFQGCTDVPLDEAGRAQAQTLTEKLATERIAAVVCSDLQRAAETARVIAKPFGLIPVTDKRLREMDFGSWEGLTWAEIVAREPKLAGVPVERAKRAPLDGESFEALCARVRTAIREVIANLSAQGRAVIVSHAGVMHAIALVMLGIDEDAALAMRFPPGGVMRLALGNDFRWKLESITEDGVAAP
jgi:broad specificity phosphatase PhoE